MHIMLEFLAVGAVQLWLAGREHPEETGSTSKQKSVLPPFLLCSFTLSLIWDDAVRKSSSSDSRCAVLIQKLWLRKASEEKMGRNRGVEGRRGFPFRNEM